MVLGRKKKDKQAKQESTAVEPAPPPVPKVKKVKAVAHFVPVGGVARAKRGEDVKALCGEKISGEPKGENPPICQDCVVAQLKVDNRTADERASTEHERGITTGKARAESEIRAIAATQERQARAELEAPRFDDLGDTVRLRPLHGGEAVVRKHAVGAITVQPTEDGRHSVVVDGLVLHTGEDEALARRHHKQLTDAVFTQRAAS